MSGSAERRPRLLFLAYYFPPQAASASVRTWNVAKYLSRLGWQVTVVTPAPSLLRRAEDLDGVAARLEHEGIARILTGVRWRCLDPGNLRCRNRGLGWFLGGLCRRATGAMGLEPQAGWGPEIAKACRHLRPGDVDVILATGGPFVAFEAARRLSERLRCPLVLDYRDPWAGNPHGNTPFLRRSAQVEQQVLRQSAAVTIVSPSLAAALRDRFRPGREPEVLFNGFDPEETARVRPASFDHFALVYTGTFYPPKRVIEPVMAALRLVSDRAAAGGTLAGDWRFHYYGPHAESVVQAARQYALEDQVVLHGSVPRAESLAAVCGAGLSVVVTSVEDQDRVEDRGIVTAKLFDALGLGTRILLVAPRGSDAGAIVEQSGFGRRFAGSETGGMASYIAEVMAGGLPRPKPPAAYAWPNLARTLDAILLRAAGSGATELHCRRAEIS